eukprot:scaffold1723_cov104-Isochrysis_galbana.AAC.11
MSLLLWPHWPLLPLLSSTSTSCKLFSVSVQCTSTRDKRKKHIRIICLLLDIAYCDADKTYLPIFGLAWSRRPLAPSASAPNDIDMGIPSSPKRPRDPVQDNKVSPRATPLAPAMLESQLVTTEYLSREPARACQSLAHHTTLMGRCRKSVDTWAPLCEESKSRSTTTKPAERLGNHGNSATLVAVAVHHRRQVQMSPLRESTRDPDTICSKEQAPPYTALAHPPDAERNPSLTALDASSEGQRRTAYRLPSLTQATHQITHKLTPPHFLPPQKGKGKAPHPPPRPPLIAKEAPEEGDDPDFVSDTNNLITVKQKGPAFQEIRDTDMGAALTYLLLELEGVDTE